MTHAGAESVWKTSRNLAGPGGAAGTGRGHASHRENTYVVLSSQCPAPWSARRGDKGAKYYREAWTQCNVQEKKRESSGQS